MDTLLHVLHTAKVHNNCPECYSTDGLQFTFSQEEVATKLYRKRKQQLEEVLQCQNCQQIIYPVNWTEDIERVHRYHKKLVKPLKPALKLSTVGWVLVVVDALILLGLIYYFVF